MPALSEQWPRPIDLDDDAGAVYGRAADLAPDLLEDALAAEFRPQGGEATYAAKIGPEDRLLDWSRARRSCTTGSGALAASARAEAPAAR